MTRKESLNKYANMLHNAATKNTIETTGETMVEDVENTVVEGIPETTVELVEAEIIEINSKEKVKERTEELKYKVKKSGEARRFKQYLETKQNTEVPEMTRGIHDGFNFL